MNLNQAMKPPTGTTHSALVDPITIPLQFGILSILVFVILFVASAQGQSANDLNPTSRNPHYYGGGAVTMDYEGFTTPKFDVLVAAASEIGRLAAVTVEVGDRVKEGDILAKLEDGLQSAAVETAKWRAQMRGETVAAQAESRLMKLRLDQLQSLAQQDMARPDELKRAAADWEIAKANELAAQEQEQLRSLELSHYELQLKRRKVLAPMDGVVAEIFHSPGEYVTPADPAVIRLLNLEQLYGVFNVPVEEAGALKIGAPVSVYLSSAAISMAGSIASISPDIDGESGTLKVKVILDNRDGTLRSGDRCRMKPVRASTAARRLPHPSLSTIRTGQEKGIPTRVTIVGGVTR